MNSIYHFFKSLVKQKEKFFEIGKLEHFPFDESLLACKNVGVFPDMAIKLNKDNQIFSCGELIEKFNQLMRIENELGKAAKFAGKKAFKNC